VVTLNPSAGAHSVDQTVIAAGEDDAAGRQLGAADDQGDGAQGVRLPKMRSAVNSLSLANDDRGYDVEGPSANGMVTNSAAFLPSPDVLLLL